MTRRGFESLFNVSEYEGFDLVGFLAIEANQETTRVWKYCQIKSASRFE